MVLENQPTTWEQRLQSPSLPTQGHPPAVHVKPNCWTLFLTWQSTVICCFFIIFMRGRTSHITCVIPLKWDGVDADRGLTAWPLMALSRRHEVAEGLCWWGPLSDGFLMPGIILDFSGVFLICLIFRVVFFIVQSLQVSNYCVLIRFKRDLNEITTEPHSTTEDSFVVSCSNHVAKIKGKHNFSLLPHLPNPILTSAATSPLSRHSTTTTASVQFAEGVPSSKWT